MKYKLCILTTDSSWGGTEKMIYTLLKGLPRDRFSVSLVTLTGDGSLVERARPFCDEVLNLNARSRTDFLAVARLARFLRRGRFHILHTFLFHANFLGRVLGLILKIPVILSSQRNVDSWRRPWHVRLDRWTAPLCDAIVSNSYAGKRRLETVEKIPSQKLLVIHNGLDLEEIPLREEFRSERERLGLSSGWVVGMVGNFWGMKAFAKGHGVLIEAGKRILQRGRDIHFVFAGEGPARHRYEAELATSPFKDHFHFLGAVSPIYRALALMDIFVLPSAWEGLPVSIMEAMAAGVPVIAADVGGVGELVRDGDTGILISSGDPVLLEQAILHLADNPALAGQLAQRAREEIFKNFNQGKMVAETVRLYERFLSEKGVP